MKRWIVCILSICMVFALAACGSKSSEPVSTENSEATEVTETTETSADVQRDLPEGDYEEVGNGTLYVVGASGSTENGDEIVVYPSMDSIPYGYVGYELWDMDGSVLTYVYVDGVEVDKHQIGAGYQSSVDLTEEWQITEGEHIIEAVQYADNDTTGEMTFYRSGKYTVRLQ